jgi:hypothetical protein
MPRLEVVLQTQPLEQAGRPMPQTPPQDCLFSRAERASPEVVGAAATVATRPKTVARPETAGTDVSQVLGTLLSTVNIQRMVTVVTGK